MTTKLFLNCNGDLIGGKRLNLRQDLRQLFLSLLYITLGSLGSCVTILGREVFSAVSSEFEYEESGKTMPKAEKLAKPEHFPNFDAIPKFGKI